MHSFMKLLPIQMYSPAPEELVIAVAVRDRDEIQEKNKEFQATKIIVPMPLA